jgi:hypothetical protein
VDEVSRLLLSLERLYNRVLQAARGFDSAFDIPPDDRLRLTRAHMETGADLAVRGVMVKVPGAGEPREVGVLDLIRDIFEKSEIPSTEDSFKALLHIKEHKAGTAVEYDASSVPVNKEADLAVVSRRLEDLRQRIGSTVAALLPGASEQDIREIADMAFEIPSQFFQRRNLWGLELE